MNNFVEWGTARTQARIVKKLKDDWEHLLSCAKSGMLKDIEDNDPKSYICYYRTFKQIAVDHLKPRAQIRRCLWIHGEPGSGKSRWVHQYFPDAFWKNANKWWCSYAGQAEVVLDDLGTLHLSEYLKRWADRYPVSAEVKGTATGLCYTTFIVTSNFDIHGIQEPVIPSDTIKAIARRFVQVEAVRWDEVRQDLLVSVRIADSKPWTGELSYLWDLYQECETPDQLRDVLHWEVLQGSD